VCVGDGQVESAMYVCMCVYSYVCTLQAWLRFGGASRVCYMYMCVVCMHTMTMTTFSTGMLHGVSAVYVCMCVYLYAYAVTMATCGMLYGLSAAVYVCTRVYLYVYTMTMCRMFTVCRNVCNA
jgi:hypothetical protein